MAACKRPWQWLPLRRLASLQRRTNAKSDAVLLALSSDDGVVPRPEDGGRQLPSDATIASYWLVEPDDLVFNPMWAIGGGVGVSQVAGAVSTAYRVYQPSADLHPRFLHYYMKSDLAITQYGLVVRGLTTFDRSVTREDLEGMPVPLPPLEEQRRIADYLDAETARIDEVIAKKERLLDRVGERLAAFAYWLTSMTGQVVPMRRIATRIQTGTTPPNFHELVADDRTSLPWYSPGDFGDGLDLRSAERELDPSARIPIFPPDSTLIVGIGASAGKVNHLDRRASGNQQLTCVTYGPEVVARFVSWQLYAIPDRLRGLAPYTTLPILNNDYLASVKLFLPDFGRQLEVVRELDAAAETVRSTQAALISQIRKLREHRQALITAAVTGQLEIPGAAA